MITVDAEAIDRFTSATESFIDNESPGAPGEYWSEESDSIEALQWEVNSSVSRISDDGTSTIDELIDAIVESFECFDIERPSTPIYDEDIRKIFFENENECEESISFYVGDRTDYTVAELMEIGVSGIINDSAREHVSYWGELTTDVRDWLENLATELYGDNWIEWE